MSKKGILVSYMGPQQGVDLSGMAKDAERLTTGPTLFLARRCTRTLSKDELAYIEEKHKGIARLLTRHSEVDPEAEAKKKASRGFGGAPEALNQSVSPKVPEKEEKPQPPTPPTPPPTPPSTEGDADKGNKGKKGKKGNKP